jgi:shikimate kinase
MIERVVLIGLSGVGKSTTAQLIGAQLGWTVIDLDRAIENETGRSIPEIFRTDGEVQFRAIESRVFRQALAQPQAVIATGGGAVIDPEIWNANCLGHAGTLTVWLDATTEQLVDRLRTQALREGA